jgi:undecaprenyl-diphosphatase
MSYLETILLGVVQGITEFLPISSDGHLAILQAVLGAKLDSMQLTVALHVGTLASILVVYAKDLPAVLRQPRICLAIVIATLPVVAVGFLLKDLIEQAFAATIWAGVGLCFTAVLLALTRRVERGERTLEQITWRDALIVGLFQAIAPLPGVSRSGSTIFAGLLSGLTREASANFSFLIAIPAIGGATVLYSRELLGSAPGDTAAGPLMAGMAISFVVGVAALRLLLRLVVRKKLAIFAWYCAVLGTAVIVWQLGILRA